MTTPGLLITVTKLLDELVKTRTNKNLNSIEPLYTSAWP